MTFGLNKRFVDVDWPLLTFVLVLYVATCDRPAFAQDLRPIRSGEVAAVSGVIVPDGLDPERPFDFRLASQGKARGWWVPDEFVNDSAACFTGCKIKLDAERERADGLVKAANDQCDAEKAVDRDECQAKIALLAQDDKKPFPWGWVAAVGGALVVGAAVGVVGTLYLKR